ncbi:methyltransferase domain-containing protein [Pseudoxanthomonas koreensis]|uniref:methyltransferase domain-containing protein n=1 Tax=Pseudoxanthomonas koreensis TaxID=266061 RepID=UPI001EE447DA|nr:methyltransferase domain-containing protein [Pseudoxanthomonas koreensis]
MNETYDNAFAEDNVYGHAVKLIDSIQVDRRGIHLDFGCGYGRMAEAVRGLGLRYIGVDVDEGGLLSLKSRGFEAMFIDLRDPAAALAQIRNFLPKDEPIFSMSIIDTLEHMEEPRKALGLMRELALEFACPAIISVPNFTHRDIGFKAAFGRFDYTKAGLLDHTHLQYFTEESLSRLLGESGWHEISKNDVKIRRSDQAFPRDHAALAPTTPLHRLLAGLRSQVNESGVVNQFVRMCLPGHAIKPRGTLDSVKECEGSEDCFLTVLTRTQGRRIDTLRETLLCLSAQTCQDFEVVVVGHDLDVESQLAVERVIADLKDGMRERVRLLRIDGGSRAKPLNDGFEVARGRYVAMLDDDDLVFGNWVETFKVLAEQNGGRLLRSVAVAQSWDKISFDGMSVARSVGGFQSIYPDEFDLFDHLVENRSPLHSLAFPRSLYSDLGFRFDSHLSTAEDWDFIIRVAPVAGVACSQNVTCIYRRWVNSENSFSVHDQDEWRGNYYYTLRKLDALPLLLPAGATRKLRDMYYELERLRSAPATASMPYNNPDEFSEGIEQERYLEALRWRYHELTNSLSWKVTSPLRYAKALFRGNKSHGGAHMLWRLSAKDLEHLIANIEGSASWRMTAPLRSLRGAMRTRGR